MNKGKSIKIGAVTYSSIAKAVRAQQKLAAANGRRAPSYMTVYMRLRKGLLSAPAALSKQPRKYTKKNEELAMTV